MFRVFTVTRYILLEIQFTYRLLKERAGIYVAEHFRL